MKNFLSDNWQTEVATSKPVKGNPVGDKINYTFAGALLDNFEIITRDCNASTTRQYKKIYNNIIIPHINNHNERRIADYNLDDCDDIVNAIIKDGYEKGGSREEYAESSLRTIKYLIFSVFKYAIISGICKDILWGTSFQIDEDRERLEILSKTVLKKSLTEEQERELVEILFNNIDEDGRIVALLLMYVLGLRCNEACAMVLGDNIFYGSGLKDVLKEAINNTKEFLIFAIVLHHNSFVLQFC